MDDIDRAKALAALEQLEAEKARRLQARVDSGEVVVVQTVVVFSPDEDIEDAKARAIARQPVPDDGRPVHREFAYICTGVPRRPDNEQEENSSSPPEIEANVVHMRHSPSLGEQAPGGGTSLSPARQPAYIYVTIRNGNEDGDPGQIAEALWSVDDGCVVLTDLDGRHIGGRALLKGEDPLPVARALLREVEERKDFNRPIRYPKLGLA
jgi:hypothetical protein